MSVKWLIPHPGTGEWTEVESFEKAMDEWFEGFNLPRLVINDKMEDSSVSYHRVRQFLS